MPNPKFKDAHLSALELHRRLIDFGKTGLSVNQIIEAFKPYKNAIQDLNLALHKSGLYQSRTKRKVKLARFDRPK